MSFSYFKYYGHPHAGSKMLFFLCFNNVSKKENKQDPTLGSFNIAEAEWNQKCFGASLLVLLFTSYKLILSLNVFEKLYFLHTLE